MSNKDLIWKSKILKKELRMCNCTESPSRPRRSFKESIKRRMKRIKSVLKTRSSNLKRMLKRGSEPSTKQDSSLRRKSKKRRWRVSS